MLLYERLVSLEGWSALRDTTVVIVNNVAKFYYEESEKTDWGPDDYPNVAPPWDNAFYEWTVPRWTNQNGTLSRLEEFGSREGVWIQSAPSTFDKGFWECTCWHFWLNRGSKHPFIVGRSRFVVTHDGQLLVAPVNLGGYPQDRLEKAQRDWEFYEQHPDEYESDLQKNKGIVFWAENKPGAGPTEEALDFAIAQLRVPWLATSFCHCKNVEISVIEPASKLSRKQERRYGTPKSRYYVLEIDPMQKILRTEGGLLEHGNLQKSLHICRGHFKTYHEKPLFGRIKGTFWWPSHARGAVNKGIVTKDYKVKGQSNDP